MAKKKSIREYVSEEDIKFQLYLVKYSNILRYIEEDINGYVETFNKNRLRKRGTFLTKLIKKVENEEDIKEGLYKLTKDFNATKFDKVVEKIQKQNLAEDNEIFAYIYNIRALHNFKPITNPQEAIKLFNAQKEKYLMYLKENNRKDDYEYIKNLKLTKNVSRDTFGKYILLMIKNLATMRSFSGYSELWKDEFFSLAIRNILSYVDNFNEELLSKRTLQPTKAFAYITQIAFNAFIFVINENKLTLKNAEKDNIEKNHNQLHKSKNLNKKSTYYQDILTEKEYIYIIKDIDNINTFKKEYKKLLKINEDISVNENNKIMLEEGYEDIVINSVLPTKEYNKLEIFLDKNVDINEVKKIIDNNFTYNIKRING